MTDLGPKSRGRITWVVAHGLNATKRLSGRSETLTWFQRADAEGNYPFYLDAIRVPQLHPNKRASRGKNKGMLSCNPLGKNPGNVWMDIPQVGHNHREWTTHPAQMPLALAERAIKMTTEEGALVVDLHAGSGTTLCAAVKFGRCAAGADLDANYLEIGEKRLRQVRDGTLPYRPAGEPLRPRRCTPAV